ncbi:MAG TPA: type II toxin-antitoxin system Phd/YefM family antitoxin [Planctomycetota bacterium]
MTLSTAKARNQFSEVINRAAYGKEHVILTRRGKKIVAVVPFEDVDLLEKLEDAQDIRDVRKVRRQKGKLVPLSQVLEELEDEQDVRDARKARKEKGRNIPWEEVKAKLGL